MAKCYSDTTSISASLCVSKVSIISCWSSNPHTHHIRPPSGSINSLRNF